MKTLEVELTRDDFIACNLHVLWATSGGHRQRRRYQCGAALLTPLGGLGAGLALGEPGLGAILGIPTAAGAWWISASWWRRAVRKSILRMAESDGLGRPGRSRLTAAEDGLHEETALGRSFQSWEGVVRVDETAEHVFIFIGPLAAFVIPKRGAGTEVAAFVDVVRQRSS